MKHFLSLLLVALVAVQPAAAAVAVRRVPVRTTLAAPAAFGAAAPALSALQTQVAPRLSAAPSAFAMPAAAAPTAVAPAALPRAAAISAPASINRLQDAPAAVLPRTRDKPQVAAPARVTQQPRAPRTATPAARQTLNRLEKPLASQAAAPSALAAAFDGRRGGGAPSEVRGSLGGGRSTLLPHAGDLPFGFRAEMVLPRRQAPDVDLGERLKRRLKAGFFRVFTEFQRLRRGKPNLRVDDARPQDVDAILKIVAAAKDELKDEDADDSGFFLGAYTRADYLKWINDPTATVLVARDKRGAPIGVTLYYGAEHILADDARRQELNRHVLAGVRAGYGPAEELWVIKHVAVHPDHRGHGTGPQMVNEVIYRALRAGTAFLMGTLVNDEPLKGTRVDRPEARLMTNRASQRMAQAVSGTRVLSGFVYAQGLVEFLADPGEYLTRYPEGLHAWEVRMRSMDSRRRLPKLSVPEQNTAPRR